MEWCDWSSDVCSSDLVDKRYMDKNVEEISAMVGFANRQSFYAAFYKNVGETPNGYRKRNQEKK